MLLGLAKDSAIYGGSDVLAKLLAFAAFPLIAAALSPTLFGLLELILTVMAMLGLLIGCGLNNSVVRFYWDENTPAAQRPALVTTGLVLQIIFGFFVLAVSCIVIPSAFPWIASGGYEVGLLGLFAGVILAILTQWSKYILDVTRLHFAPWRYLFLVLASRVLGLGLALLVVVYLNWGIDGYLGVQALAFGMLLPVAIWAVRKDIEPKFSGDWSREMLKFGYPFIFVGAAYWLFGSIDRWMLASMVTVEDVGIYSVAWRFASIALLVSTAFGLAWSPYAIKIKTERPDAYREFYVFVLSALMLVMLLVAGLVALYSGEILDLIMPEEYFASAAPLAVLVIGVALQSTQQVTAVGISLEKKTHLFAWLAWTTAAINALLNYVLIPRFGILGAAWATTVSYFVLTASYLYFTQRLHPLPFRWGVLTLLVLYGICIVAVAIGMREALFVPSALLTKLLVLLAGFAGLVYLLKSARDDFKI